MRKRLIVSFMIVALMMFSRGLTGCSRTEEPTPAELAKSIVEYALSTNCSIIVSSIKIVEKGRRGKDGSLPYKVYFACNEPPAAGGKKAAGSAGPEPAERFMTLTVYQTTDSAGKPVWAARR